MREDDDILSLPSILQLAHRALGLAVSCSQTMTSTQEKQTQLQPIVDQAKRILRDWKEINDKMMKQNATDAISAEIPLVLALWVLQATDQQTNSIFLPQQLSPCPFRNAWLAEGMVFH